MDNKHISEEAEMIFRVVERIKDVQKLFIALRALGMQPESQDNLGIWMKTRYGRLGYSCIASHSPTDVYTLMYKPDKYHPICLVEEGKLKEFDSLRDLIPE